MAHPVNGGSNDLLADRRFAWAKGLADEGDHAAASDLLEQVVEIAPGWAPAWCALAQAREHAGGVEGARRAWRQAAALDPDGRLGAALHLARLDGTTPAAMPAPYIQALFDDYAPRFEAHLRQSLAYRGPEVIGAAIETVAPGRRFDRVLDLGCGTGLMGLALASRVEKIEGVDLSPRMIEAARRTGAYAALTTGSLDEALAAAASETFDLVTAADVLIYFGDLAPVMAGVARVLAPAGLFGFTVQRATGQDIVIGPDLRFAHGEAYIRRVVRDAGLDMAYLTDSSIRTESGRPVPGLVAVAIPTPAKSRHHSLRPVRRKTRRGHRPGVDSVPDAGAYAARIGYERQGRVPAAGGLP